MNQYISIACIARPHGFRGAFVAHSLLGRESALSYLTRVFVGKNLAALTEYPVESSDWMPKGWKLKLKGFDSDEDVKAVQQWEVFALREDLRAPLEGEYYVSDLLGLEGVDIATGQTIGLFTHLSEVSSSSGKVFQHSWHFKSGDKEFSLPAIPKYVHAIDLQAKKIFLRNLAEFDL